MLNGRYYSVVRVCGSYIQNIIGRYVYLLHKPISTISIVLKYIILPTYNSQYSYNLLKHKLCFDSKNLLL